MGLRGRRVRVPRPGPGASPGARGRGGRAGRRRRVAARRHPDGDQGPQPDCRRPDGLRITGLRRHVPEVSDAVTLAMEAAGLVSLGKTSTPEFGSPCYTEPEGRPPRSPHWTRLGSPAAPRWRGGRVAAGAGPGGAGSDGGVRSGSGVVLRPGRPKADPRPDQWLPIRRPDRPGHLRLDRAHGRRRRGLLDVLAGRG